MDINRSNYLYFIFIFVSLGTIYGIYDNNLMNSELNKFGTIEYDRPIRVKKESIWLFRDGRTRILNDSIAIDLTLNSFDYKFDLYKNWGNVDSLIKVANNDTLKCKLYSGEVVYLKVYNPSQDNGW